MIRHLRLTLLTIPLLLLGAACTSLTPEPASDYYASIRVTSTAMGGGVKVNGMLAAALPGRIQIEVDENGAVLKPYTIQLSTNIMGDARYTLEPGDYVPARIDFAGGAASATGQAPITYRGAKTAATSIDDSGDS